MIKIHPSIFCTSIITGYITQDSYSSYGWCPCWGIMIWEMCVSVYWVFCGVIHTRYITHPLNVRGYFELYIISDKFHGNAYWANYNENGKGDVSLDILMYWMIFWKFVLYIRDNILKSFCTRQCHLRPADMVHSYDNGVQYVTADMMGWVNGLRHCVSVPLHRDSARVLTTHSGHGYPYVIFLP